jgi:dienelactone hydrolase
VIGERFRRQVIRILDEAAETRTESYGGGYGGSLIRAPYPTAPRPGHIPADISFARLCFHFPDGTQWSPTPLREVVGRPIQHPVRPELFAGVAACQAGLRCWVADVEARTVNVVPPAPAASAGGEAPLAWAGSSLAVAVEAPGDVRHDVRHVFEAPPGERIRLTPAHARTERHPSTVVIVDLPNASGPEALSPAATSPDSLTGAGRPIGLRARPYRRVRGAMTGQVAACTDGGVIAVGGCGPLEEHVVQAGGRVLEFHWLTAPGAAHLVLLTESAGGFTLSSYAARGAEIGSGDLLYRHRGRYLHAHCRQSIFVLALDDEGTYSVILVSPDRSRPDVRVLPLPVRWPTILKIAAVRPERGPAFATVDTENKVVIWAAPPGAAAPRRARGLALPPGEELVTIAAWDRPGGTTVLRKRTPNTPLPAHPGGPPPLHGRAGAAEFALRLPKGRAAGCLVWLSQHGAPPTCGAPAGGPDPYWLTLAGFAVLDVRIVPAWWPAVPDEEIRPRLVRQILEAVAGSGVDRHVDSGRLAVGGTSFGATLALLAIADCDLFGTAIAQSGAYARQLTPLGFQDETRTLWEAPLVYRDFDAVVNAPRIRKPVLIIHGEADPNPATPVAQATLLFQALIANGTRARLVVLSGEGHAPLTRDGIAAALAEKAAWLRSWQTAQ